MLDSLTIPEKQALRIKIRSSSLMAANGCNIWLRGRGGDGYGYIHLFGKTKAVHLIAYELLVGPIEVALELDHLCRNRACWNPDHLEQVTTRTNILRGMAPSADHARQTHCIHGHPLSGDNLYQYHNHRFCRTCRRTEARVSARIKRATIHL